MEKSGVSAAGRAGRAVERWLTIHDELLRGIVHALSNRVATIDAATYLLAQGDADVAAQTATLRGEIDRLEALLRAMRVLPRQADAAAEPVMAGDVVQAALALVVHHGDLRDVQCDVAIGDDVPPAYADPNALEHALLVAIAAAGRAAGRTGIELRVSSATDAVRFAVTPRDAGAGVLDDGDADKHTVDAEAIEWLLADFGGSATPVRGGAEFTVPTLSAARRRERGNL